MSKPFPALYEMEGIGINGEPEAVATRWFCSERCRNIYETDLEVEAGLDAEYIGGTCCDECGKTLGN